MHSDFQRIWSLLREDLENRPLARGDGDLPEEMSELISMFADGRLDPKHRDRLIAAMSERPDWVVHLAAAIKARRDSEPGNSE